MTHIKSPFFIEATEENIDGKLIAAGIFGGKKLPPPYGGVSRDGRIWEMFRSESAGKSGWMVHDTGRRIKPESLSKYIGDRSR